MNREGMLSVIVPVYGVEKYLDRCVESLIHQTYVNMEIILVDDGSKDNSPKMCDDWSEKDSRIKVIHKENGGLGSARNAGLDVAKGGWITFVDSDDYLELNAYELCFQKLNEASADICYFGSAWINRESEIIESRCQFPEILEKEKIYTELLPKCFGRYFDDVYDLGTAWMGVYRAKLLRENHIRFVSERELISEDYVYTLEVCRNASKICFINRCLYMYCENVESLSNTFREDRFQKIELFYLNRLEYIKELGLTEDAAVRAGVRFWNMVIGCIKSEFKSKELTYKQKKIRFDEVSQSKISKRLLINEIYKHMNVKERLLLKTIEWHNMSLCYLLVFIRNLKLV